MENQQNIEKAKSILRSIGGNPSQNRRSLGYLDDTREKNSARLKALDGLCGSCPFLKVDIQMHSNGNHIRKTVGLRCNKGYSPVDLYLNKNFRETPTCPGYQKKSS